MNTKIRLLLADDSGEFRALLQKNLEEHPEIQVVGAAGDGEELVQLSSQLSPDIILTDTVVALQTSCEKFSYNLQKRNGA